MLGLKNSRTRALWLFLIPAVLSFLLIFAYPLVRTIYLSFFKVTDLAATDLSFRGFQQYIELWHTRLFLISFRNIVLIGFVGGVVSFAWVFIFAMLLHSGIRGKKFFRAAIYLPNLIPAAAIAALWTQYIYNPRFGLWKTFFDRLGFENLAKIQWNSPDLLLWGMMIAFVWAGIGWTLIIVLAGMERIPAVLYEVATLDGASIVQQFRYVTLPLLRDVLRITVIFWSMNAINLFTFPKLWTPVVPQEGTYTPAIYLYEITFAGGSQASTQNTIDMGKGSAIAVMLLIFVLLTAFLINKLFSQEPLEF